MPQSENMEIELDSAFPLWGNIQFYGPPGAGKSYLADQASRTHRAPTSGSILYPPFRLDWKGDGRAPHIPLPAGVREQINKLRVRHACRRQMRGPLASRYKELVARVAAEGFVPGRAGRYHVRRVMREYALLKWLAAYDVRVLCDEGLLQSLVGLIAFEPDPARAKQKRSAIIGALEAYPGDRNAVLVTADAELCVRRQLRRGRVAASPTLPQQRFHDAAKLLLEILNHSEWKTISICNNAASDLSERPMP